MVSSGAGAAAAKDTPTTSNPKNNDKPHVSFPEDEEHPSSSMASPPRIFRGRTSESNNSDGFSLDGMSSDGNYEVIEYDIPKDNANNNNNNNDDADIDDDIDDDVFQQLGAVSIQEDSPAAAALRANAEIQVSSLGKAARAVHMQTVRRALKRAAGKGRSNRKGKPPRVPFGAPHGTAEDELYSSEEEDDDTAKQHLYQQHAPPPLDVYPEVFGEDDDEEEGAEADADAAAAAEEDHEDDESTVHTVEKDEVHIQPSSPPKTPEHPADMGNHIPDGVAPGTVEAGKKGGCSYFSPSYF